MKLEGTVAEISRQIETIDTLTDPRWQYFIQDERLGIQKKITQHRHKLAKQAQLKQEWRAKQQFEEFARKKGYHWIAGIDEVGRGPIAGPVVACAVILPEDTTTLIGVNDSKQLSAKKRVDFAEKIQACAISYAFGVVSAQEIDRVNIYQATQLAMIQALSQLSVQPDYLLIDAMHLDTPLPQESIIKGDQHSLSIACASILAKEYRDQLMRAYDVEYPGYYFDKHAGYGTKAHLEALDRLGPSPIHRLSFEPVKSLVQNNLSQ